MSAALAAPEGREICVCVYPCWTGRTHSGPSQKETSSTCLQRLSGLLLVKHNSSYGHCVHFINPNYKISLLFFFLQTSMGSVSDF